MNVKTLNTTSLDGDVVIIKKGSSQGGGSTPPSGGSNIEYLDVSGDSPLREGLIAFCYLIKTDGFNIQRPGNALVASRSIVPSSNLIPTMVDVTYEEYSIISGSIKAVAIDFNTEVMMDDVIVSIKAVFTGAEELLNAIPRLTKEQFYTL